MNHTKVLRREDGSQVQIHVELVTDWRGSPRTWRWFVLHREKGKRKWLSKHSTDNYEWRRLRGGERWKYERDIYLQQVSEEEVLETMRELIAQLEPDIG